VRRGSLVVYRGVGQLYIIIKMESNMIEIGQRVKLLSTEFIDKEIDGFSVGMTGIVWDLDLEDIVLNEQVMVNFDECTGIDEAPHHWWFQLSDLSIIE